MTSGKDLKRLVRRHMKATGKSYSEARRELLEKERRSVVVGGVSVSSP
jgi:type II secretory pathway component PulJ